MKYILRSKLLSIPNSKCGGSASISLILCILLHSFWCNFSGVNVIPMGLQCKEFVIIRGSFMANTYNSIFFCLCCGILEQLTSFTLVQDSWSEPVTAVHVGSMCIHEATHLSCVHETTGDKHKGYRCGSMCLYHDNTRM